jgi:predicted ATPase
MIQKLRLRNFKNFRDATIELGPFSVLVGANASGKSNVRDALRVLHGIGRGYPLADIFGERWSESGEKVWSGIRGGTREAAFFGETVFGIEVTLGTGVYPAYMSSTKDQSVTYRIDIELGPRDSENSIRVFRESLTLDGEDDVVFDTHRNDQPLGRTETSIGVRLPLSPVDGTRIGDRKQPLIQQPSHYKGLGQFTERVLSVLRSMRFFEFQPAAMRRPSVPGQTVLGDRGENLSSVLQAIREDDEQRERLTSWVRELTPMDVVDFRFPTDVQGRTQVVLVEEGGREVSAESASAGTLRLLGVLAAVLGPEHARTSFFEELENGIHPTRLHLLLQLIEQNVSDDPDDTTQVLATTHSPQLLRFLSEESLEATSVIYRSEDRPDATIVPVMDIPHIEDVLERKDLGRLFESGWMENTLAFAEAGDGKADS